MCIRQIFGDLDVNVHDVIVNFQIQGRVHDIIPWGNGHINDSYRVINEDEMSPDYLLQRVNHLVFENVDGLMQNLQKVTDHIQAKDEFQVLVLNIIPTKEGEAYFNNPSGFWRMFEFVSDKKTYDRAENAELAYKAGSTIGKFVVALSDFPVDELHLTIPDFHNIRFRIQQFEDALERGDSIRREEAEEEIKKVQALSKDYMDLYDFAISGEIPLRVTHNDTKFNNVLLSDVEDMGIVIDLDTIMPGYVFYDLGDGLRSGVIEADEDESDLSKVILNEAFYRAYMDGFLKASKSILTQKEIAILPKSGSYMAFIMAVRFLTDFLNGDVYYKTEYQEHNLVRARCQLKVCELFQEYA